MLLTLRNAAMAGGGVVGGVVLGRLGTGALPWTMPAPVLPALVLVLAARTRGFPARRG
ncbi:hypothetical protein ACWCXH_15240 [Kitasatospora sp. NPDC001660]